MSLSSSHHRWIKSFVFAWRGIRSVCATELNFRIHLCITGIIVALGFAFGVSLAQWAALILATGLVLTAEALNTAVEYLADALHPEENQKIALAKDAAAAGVLIAAIAAALVGAIVFLPEIWELLQKTSAS